MKGTSSKMANKQFGRVVNVWYLGELPEALHKYIKFSLVLKKKNVKRQQNYETININKVKM